MNILPFLNTRKLTYLYHSIQSPLNYRAYKCRIDCSTILCEKLKYPWACTLTSADKIIYIHSMLPESIDSIILRYKATPTKMIVRDHQS